MQQSIRIYTPYMDLLHETDNYLSLQFTPKFYEVGEFEVHVNQYTEGAEYFQKNNLIMLDKQKDKVGIIRHREIALDETGKLSENWKITGVALKGVLSQRVTIPPETTGYDRKSGDAETVMKHYVENHFINPDDPDRQIDHIEVAPNKNRGAHIEWESRFKNVDEEIIAISKQANLGWVIYADMVKKKWIFDVVEPRDVTQGNEAGLPPVFFSPDFQTIKTQQFVDSDVNLKNFGYVGGQGEGVDRLVEKIGVSKGLERLEAFIDARDVGGSGEEDLTPEQIQEKLIERGQSKLDEMKTDFYLEAQILTPTINDNSGRFALKTPFEYEVDFRLGDTVQVFNKKWNITMDAPITAFKEIHEVGGFVLEATFGEAQPTLISKIKGKFDEISGIEQQELPVQIAVERMQDAKDYSDANLSEEEKARIAQAQDNLEESLNYTDDQDVIYDKLAKEYAEAARIAAEAVAVAKANLAETNAKSYADGIVTDEEAARIAQAEADLAEAKAASALAKTQAKAYADGIVSDEEARAIADAQAKLALAKADATAKDVIVFEDGKTFAELKKQEALQAAATDAKTKADAAQLAAEKYALAKADAAEVDANAHADGIVTTEERARIDAVNQAVIDAAADAKTKADAAEAAAKTYTNSQLTNYVGTTIYDEDMQDIKAQIDNQITTHFYPHEPTLTNLPASEWTTEDLRIKHVGDLFYISDAGYGYRFLKDGTTYKWEPVRDEGIIKALADAAQAQDTADGKRRTFVEQPTTPYDKGDLWVDETNGKPKVYSSLVDKTKSATFSQADWKLIGDVTGENTSNDTSNVGGRPSSDIEDVQGAQAKASAAEQAAKAYAVAKTVYDTKMQGIATDLGDKAGLDYVDGELVRAISDIDIGVRNIILNSDFATGDLSKWGNNGSVIFGIVDGRNVAIIGTARGIYQRLVKSTSIYTFSFVAKALDSTTSARVGFLNQGTGARKTFSLTAEWKKYSYTTTEEILDGQLFHIYSTGKSYYITDIKVEKGNKATDHTPAPEDQKAYADNIVTVEEQARIDQAKADLAEAKAHADTNAATKADKLTTYTITEVDNALNNYVGVTSYQTDQDGVVQTLDSHGTRLGQNETAIGLKASQTDLNTVEGTVSDNSAALTVQAGKIESKVDATYVSGAVADVETHLEFDGVDDYVPVGAISETIGRIELDFYSETDILPDSIPQVLVQTSGNNSGILLGASTSSLSGEIVTFYPENTIDTLHWVDTNEKIPAGWNNLIFEYDGTKFRMYLNGQEKSLIARNDTFPQPFVPDNITIGRRDYNGGTSYYEGSIKNIIFSNTTGNVIHNWKLGEGTGITAYDSTGNNDGEINGATWQGIGTKSTELINATLSDHSTAITQTADKVETKAESSVVNALTGRVDTAEGNITTIAGKVELKAESSVTDALGTRLNSAEIDINGLDSTIKLKVDKDGVIAAIRLSSETALIEAENINLVGAVTVLSDITGDLGTITAGEISGANIYSPEIHSTKTGNSFLFWENTADYYGLGAMGAVGTLNGKTLETLISTKGLWGSYAVDGLKQEGYQIGIDSTGSFFRETLGDSTPTGNSFGFGVIGPEVRAKGTIIFEAEGNIGEKATVLIDPLSGVTVQSSLTIQDYTEIQGDLNVDGQLTVANKINAAGGIQVSGAAGAYVFTNAVDNTVAGTNLYLRTKPGGEIKATENGTTGNYLRVTAKDFYSTSVREKKKDIVKLVGKRSAMSKIKSTPVYEYRHNNDKEGLAKTVGLMFDESPEDIRGDKSVGHYAMISLVWKASQELDDENQELLKRIEKLEGGI